MTGKGRPSEEHRVCPCWLKIGQCWVVSLLCVHVFCGEDLALCLQSLWCLFFSPPVVPQEKYSSVPSLCSCCLISEPKLSPVEGLEFFVWSCPVDRSKKLILFSWAWKNPLITLFPKPFLVTKFISYSNKPPIITMLIPKYFFWRFKPTFISSSFSPNVKVCCCLHVVSLNVRDGV